MRQLSVIKKTQKFSKIGKIDKKLLKSSKNCYTGNIFKAAEKQAAKGFDRACRKRLFGLCGGRMLVCRSMAGSPISICLWIRFDRAIFAALCLRLCMFLRFYDCGAVCCQGFLLLLVALIVRYRCYGVVLMALRTFARLSLRFTGHFDFALLKLSVVAALCFCF